MSNRLGGRQGTAYVGTNAVQPPDYTFSDRDPNQYDINNVSLGDLWLNQSSKTLWALVSLERDVAGPGSSATWSKLENSGMSGLDTITGSTGGAVPGDVNANINLVSGIFGFSFDGNPGTNTITLNSTITPDNVVETLTANTGGPVGAILGNINVVGDNVGITAVGNPGTNTVTFSLIGGGDAAETFPTDSGTANASGGVLNIITDNSAQTAGSSVFFSGSGNTVQLHVTDVHQNVLMGESSGNATVTGTNNTALGVASLSLISTGDDNTCIGSNAGGELTTGSRNTLLGYQSGEGYLSSESNNITINSPGVATESNALRIGISTGTGAGELNKAFIQGIVGITPATADGVPVFIGSAGQLGTVGSGGSAFVSTTTGNSGGAVSPLAGNINIVGDGTTAVVVGNPGTHTLTISTIGGGGGDLTVLAGDSGSATPTAGTINIISGLSTLNSGSSVSFVGASSTLTFNVTDANDNTIIGRDSGDAGISGLNNTAIGQTSVAALTTGNDNTVIGSLSGGFTTGSFNTLMGVSTGSNYTGAESSNILIGYDVLGTVATSNTLTIGNGTGTGSGQVNKSFIAGIRGITPASADGIPVFIGSTGQLGTVGSGGSTFVGTVTGNSGGAVSPLAGNINIVGDGTTATVVGNPGTHTLTISTIGGGGGDLTVLAGDTGSATPLAGTINIISGVSTANCGSTVLISGASHTLTLNVTDSNDNTIAGKASGNSSITGNTNTIFGSGIGADLTTGVNNVVVGAFSGGSITSGSYNTIIGVGAGDNLNNTERSNIYIGYSASGAGGQSNALQIGSGAGIGEGQLNKAFIYGIRGITPASTDGIPVFIGSNGQLGTVGSGIIKTISGNTGGPVPALSSTGNVNIVGDGTTVNIVGNPGTNTLTVSAIGGGGGGAGNPSFMAYFTNNTNLTLTSQVPSKLVYDTLAYNLGSAFNIGTSTFTAPTTGLYNFSCGLYFKFNTGGGLLTAIPYVMQLTTTQNNFSLISPNLLGGVGGTNQIGFTMGNSFYCNMNSGDTAFVTLTYPSTSIGLTGTGSIQGSTGGLPGVTAGVFTFFGGSFIA